MCILMWCASDFGQNKLAVELVLLSEQDGDVPSINYTKIQQGLFDNLINISRKWRTKNVPVSVAF